MIFSTGPIIPGLGFQTEPSELRIPHLCFHKHLEGLRCIFNTKNFIEHRVRAQKRPERAILRYFENL